MHERFDLTIQVMSGCEHDRADAYAFVGNASWRQCAPTGMVCACKQAARSRSNHRSRWNHGPDQWALIRDSRAPKVRARRVMRDLILPCR
jgi:hypothetical protein